MVGAWSFQQFWGSEVLEVFHFVTLRGYDRGGGEDG